ncbi:MAG: crotonase/enoyl-CoA hydratase family protein, partial [Myxococcota bacterium]
MTAEPYSELRVERDGFVAEVVLCHPEKRNAMTTRFFHECGRAFAEIDEDPALRVAIVRAEGPTFSAGLDLKEAGEDLLAADPGPGPKPSPAARAEALHRSIRALQGGFSAIERCRKPVIAAIQGHCVGGGVDLASACDIRLCSRDASFSIYEARVGIVADVGTLQRITPIVGKGMAREMAFTARFIDAERALGCGLVNEVHPDPEALLEGARRMAHEIAANAPLAVQGTKQVLNYSDEHSTEEGLEYVAQWNASRLHSHDLSEA